jgi:hypothetical protein
MKYLLIVIWNYFLYYVYAYCLKYVIKFLVFITRCVMFTLVFISMMSIYLFLNAMCWLWNFKWPHIAYEDFFCSPRPFQPRDYTVKETIKRYWNFGYY